MISNNRVFSFIALITCFLIITGCSAGVGNKSESNDNESSLSLDDAIEKAQDLQIDATIEPYEQGEYADNGQQDDNESDSNDESDTDTESIEHFDEDLSLSSVLYDFTFKLEGDTITLPLTLEDFQSYGWGWDSSLELAETMESNTISTVTFTKNGKEAVLSLVNMSDETLPINECLVYGISSYSYEIFDGEYVENENFAVIELPKGIVLGSSAKNDIIEAYGYPTYSQSYYEEDYDDLFQYDNSELLGESIFIGEARGVEIIIGKEKEEAIIEISINNASQK